MMSSFRISVPLLLATLAVLASIVALSVVGWVILERSERRADAPEAEILSAALQVARRSTSMVAQGTLPTTGQSMNPDVLADLSAALDRDQAALQESLDTLVGTGYDERVTEIQRRVDTLVSNSDLIESGRPALLRLEADSQANLSRIVTVIQRTIEAQVHTGLDNQFNHVLSYYEPLGASAQTVSEPAYREEILRYYHLHNLLESSRTGASRLRATNVVIPPFMITRLREDYDAAARRIEDSLGYLSEHAEHSASAIPPETMELGREVIYLGQGEGNLWDKQGFRFGKVFEERRLIAGNQKELEALLADVDALGAAVAERAEAAASTASRTAATWRIILLALAVVGVAATLFAAWYFATRDGARNQGEPNR